MAVVVAALMWLQASQLSTTGITLLAAAWGAMAFPVYSISVAHANDRAETGNFVMVSAGLLLMYGIGAVIGPFVASTMMTLGGAADLFLFTGVIHLLLTIYVMVRSRKKKQASAEDHKPFADALASTQTRSQVYEEVLEKEQEAAENLAGLNP